MTAPRDTETNGEQRTGLPKRSPMGFAIAVVLGVLVGVLLEERLGYWAFAIAVLVSMAVDVGVRLAQGRLRRDE